MAVSDRSGVIAAGLLLAAAFVAGLVGALEGLMWPSLLGLALFGAFAIVAYRVWLHRAHGAGKYDSSKKPTPVGAESLNGGPTAGAGPLVSRDHPDAAERARVAALRAARAAEARTRAGESSALDGESSTESADASELGSSGDREAGAQSGSRQTAWPTSGSSMVPCSVRFHVPPTLEAPAVVSALLDGARETGDAVAAHLWLLDPPTATLRLVAAAGPLAPPPIPVPVDDLSLGVAVTRGSAVLTPPVTAEAGDEPASPIRFRFAVPVSAGAARGVAAVDVLSADAPDTGALIALFSQGAGLLAGSLALHVARDETRQSRLLTEASRDLTRRVDEAALVRRALDRAVELSSAATGSVMLIDDETGRMRIVASVGLPDEIVAATDVAEGDGIAGWVLATRKPMLVEDLPGSQARGTSRHGVRSALSVPVQDEDGALGVINVGSRGYPARFTDQHTQSLETLSAQLAVALRNARAMRVTEDLYFGTLRALAMAMETKDPFAHGATERIATLAEALGDQMDMTADEREALRVAALLHDIGMEAAGEAVRSADRPLTLTERGLLTMHPVIAADILREVPALKEVAPIVYHHHERFDGTGYVGGLSGEDIPLGSRILSVLDSYTAMTSPRPWRGARSVREALREIKHNAGSQFDPRVVDAFCALAEREPELVSGSFGPEAR